MNPEVIKAMQGKKEHKARKWWRKNGYKVWRVALFPLWIGGLLKDKIEKHLNSKEEWNEERATAILNYYVPRVCKWNKEENYFYFFDNGMGWNLKFAKKYLKTKDYRFWEVNTGFFGGKIRDFLMKKFELEGFSKELGNCSEGWTEISFYLKNKEPA